MRQQIENAVNTTSDNNSGNDAIRLVTVSGLSLKSTTFFPKVASVLLSLKSPLISVGKALQLLSVLMQLLSTHRADSKTVFRME